jgi:phosphoribosylglycinamide formyltransferase-1
MINLHPSLLPLYPGLRAIESSYEAKANMGITVHTVVPEMDSGPIVMQSLVFKSKDSLEDFEKASLMMTFREHFLVRRIGEKWN